MASQQKAPQNDRFHPTRFEDVAVTIDFHCNSACQFLSLIHI